MLTGKEARLCDCSGFEIRPAPNSALPLTALWLVTNNLMSLSLSFPLCTNGDNCPYKLELLVNVKGLAQSLVPGGTVRSTPVRVAMSGLAVDVAAEEITEGNLIKGTSF